MNTHEIAEPTEPRGSHIKPKKSGLKSLVLAPIARKALTGLTRRLATADPAERHHAVAALVANSSVPVLAVAIDTLLAAMLRSDKPDRRAALTDALVEVGPAIANKVGLALLKTKKVQQQVALAGLLERVGPLLPGGERVGLLLILPALATKVTGAAAVEAVERAVTAIRVAINRP